MSKISQGVVAGAIALGATQASATTYLMDKDDSVKAFVKGFAEFDAISDSTRSLTEVQGNNAVAPPSKADGKNGRVQMGVRNSRFGFGLQTQRDGVKATGYIEFDLLGYDPATGDSVVKNSESSFWQNPTARVRHAYTQIEGDGWSLLTGQYWSLFGWQNEYVISTITVSPIAGTLYERTPQATFMKTFGSEDATNLQLGISLARPTQRDSAQPDVDAGVRLRLGGLRGVYSGTSGDVKADVASIAVTGTAREFVRPTSTTDVTAQKHYHGSAVAVDAMIPIIGVSKGEAIGNTLSYQGEYSKGTGYGDELSGWSANEPTLIANSASYTPNLDSGLAGWDKSGKFALVQLQTWNSSLQYHLPAGWDTFTTAGFAETSSSNVADLRGTAALVAVAATRAESLHTRADIVHQLLPRLRQRSPRRHRVQLRPAFVTSTTPTARTAVCRSRPGTVSRGS